MNLPGRVSDTLQMSLTARTFDGVRPTTPAPDLPPRRSSRGGAVLRFRRVPARDFDVVAIRDGRDVLVCIDEDHLTKRGARTLNAALDELEPVADPLDEIC